MLKLLAGLALFHGLHLVPTMPKLRGKLQGIAGAGAYKIVFSIASVVSLILMVRGYKSASVSADNLQLWVPPVSLRMLTFILMWPALVLLVSAYVPSRIRSWAKHPMLAAIFLWALAHLIVRGDLAGVLLFGSFLAYSLIDMNSATKRAALGPLGAKSGGLRGDVIAVVVGSIAYFTLLFWLHGAISGMPLRP